MLVSWLQSRADLSDHSLTTWEYPGRRPRATAVWKPMSPFLKVMAPPLSVITNSLIMETYSLV